jgi:hypothetical protein
MTPDPISSTAQWLDAACGGKPIPSLLIVVGIDEGHLLDVLDKRGSSAKVLAIEPDRAMAGTFQSRRDLNTWRSSGRLTHLVHPDYSGADEAWRMFPNNANDCLLMVNPRLKEGSPEVAAAARTAQKILYGVRANAAARRQFAPRYLTNVIRNTPAIATGGDVRALTNAFQGIPAVIAAAGPSLDAAIPELQRMNGQGLLIAVDTALRPMLEAGITPQLVTALDPSLLNARHFQMLADCPDTWLVAESALDRGAAAPFDGRTFWPAHRKTPSMALAQCVRHRGGAHRRVGFRADGRVSIGVRGWLRPDHLCRSRSRVYGRTAVLSRHHVRVRLGLEHIDRP